MVGGIMAFLKDIVQRFADYVLNNQLDIDKSTFLTIVIGQITMYGILLTFYQFVASYQASKKTITRYLGVNLTEYYIKKNTSAFTNIVSKKVFGIIFVIEILYKPIMTIFKGMCSARLISVMNFVWYLFVIFYFVIFVILFFQCTKSILMIKLCSDAKTNGSIIRDINRRFLHKTLHERINQKAVDLLNEDFEELRDAIKYDDNSDLQSRYNHLIYNICNTYIEQKADEIFKIEKYEKIVKNQIIWKYNANCEIHLLKKILDGGYFALDDDNKKIIFLFHMQLLKLNLRRAQLAGYQKLICDKYESICRKTGEKVFDASEWKNAILKIYKNLNDEMKGKLIHFLQSDDKQNQNFYKIYCDECILSLIENEIESIFEGERQQKEFIKIFGEIVKEEEVNDFFSDIIRDKIISYNRFDAGEIITQLSKKNCTYLFSYIMIFYSVYRFRFEWEYFNISVLKALWGKHSSMKDDAEDVIKRISKSNIGHRFVNEMYTKFWGYIERDVDGTLLNEVGKDRVLNVFYVFIYKICITNSEYSICIDDIDEDIQITIINELSKHDELLENKNVMRWIYHMRYNNFAKWKSIPKNLNISLKSLLLTNLNCMDLINSESAPNGLYSNCIGMYLLIKIQELSVKNQKQKRIKELVRTAFISSNLNVDEFINMLEKECCICKCEINYVQKEKMKEYLLKVF